MLIEFAVIQKITNYRRINVCTLFFFLIICRASFAFGAFEINYSELNTALRNNKRWDFQLDGTIQLNKIQIGRTLGEQLPLSLPCCTGTYSINLTPELGNIVLTGNSEIALFLPPTGGLKSVHINGEIFSFPNSDNSSVGQVIALSREIFKSHTLTLKLDIDNPRTPYAGLWFGPPVFGKTSDLGITRDLLYVHQKVVPMFLVYIFSLLSIVFIVLLIQQRLQTNLINEYCFALISFSIFFIFLSGAVRNWFPLWGGILHLPCRSLAGLSMYRLIGAHARIKHEWLKKITILSIPIILGQILAGYFGFLWVQPIISVMFIGSAFFAGFRLAMCKRNFHENVVLGASSVMLIGYASDSLKLILPELGFQYHIVFLNRYTTPFVLFTSISFLATNLIREIRSNLRMKVIEELSVQVSHDIRAPLGALMTLQREFDVLPDSSKVLAKMALDRLREIAESLPSQSNDLQADASSLNVQKKIEVSLFSRRCLLAGLIEPVVLEKTLSKIKVGKIILNWQGPQVRQKIEVKVVESEFKRVISNLLDNALDAVEKNGQVRVLVEAVDGTVRIIVEDTGKGIPLDVLRRLGQRGVTNGKVNGSGLGIWAAKISVEKWGGHFAVISQENVGTEVVITLPFYLD